LIGRLGAGRGAGAAESAVCLEFLNQMLLNWSTERLNVFQVLTETFALTIATAAYTMGPSEDFDTARPVRIEAANVVSSSIREPLELIGVNEWNAIDTRTDTSIFPKRLYCDYAYPAVTLNFWKIPSAAASVELHSWKILDAFSALTDTVAFPLGYERAIVYNLAIDLAPAFGKSISAEVAAIAKSSKAGIVSLNALNGNLQLPVELAPERGK
jgi:hypothetical protein